MCFYIDKDSYKLSLLKDALNLIHVRIFSPKPIPENRVFADVLTAYNSPYGIQVHEGVKLSLGIFGSATTMRESGPKWSYLTLFESRRSQDLKQQDPKFKDNPNLKIGSSKRREKPVPMVGGSSA